MAAAIGLAMVGPVAGAQIVTNGSFEVESAPSNLCTGSFRTLFAPSTVLAGWTVATGNLDWICTLWTADDGLRSLDMNGTAPARIEQTVTLTPGATYQLSFAMAGNAGGGPTLKTMTASIAGFSQSYTFDITGHSYASMGWQTFTATFVPTLASNVLAFESTVPSSNAGPALDDVSIIQLAGPPSTVPEPATVALVGGGLLALAGVARRRRA
jgi:choice-of-anchor C domain-containing protein